MSDNPLQAPPWLNAPPVEPYPFADTHDLREGPDLSKALNQLLPFLGVWRGRGVGGYPTIEDFHFAQELRISHDGRPFLAYESKAWLIEEDGTPIRVAAREVGWIRPVFDADGTATDEVEVLLSSFTGVMELYVGRVDGVKLELATDAVVRTSTAKPVAAGHRLYGIVDGALLYVHDMAAVGQQMSSHLSARLLRIAG